MIFRHFIGEYDFKASGANTVLFLNMLRENRISVHNLYTRNNDVYGKIYAYRYGIIKETAEKCKMDISIKNKSGIILKLKPYKKRYGIAVGIVAAFVLIFFLSNITLCIRVTGCSDDLYEQVISVLEINGVSPGKYIPSMDFNQIERNIVATLNDVAWVSVRNSGGTIIIDVTESTKKPNVVLERLPSNIVSTKDAQITDVQVYSGQLKTLIGNGVKKGELLVSGLIENRFGETFYYHSRAKIFGIYSETVCFASTYEEDKKVISSDTIIKKYLNFFSIRIPVSFGSIPSGEFVYDERTTDFSFISFDLPLGVTRCYYKPYETKHYTYSEEEVRENLNEQIETYEKNYLKDCTIISRDIFEEKTSEKIIYTVKYKVEGDITKQSEILIK